MFKKIILILASSLLLFNISSTTVADPLVNLGPNQPAYLTSKATKAVLGTATVAALATGGYFLFKHKKHSGSQGGGTPPLSDQKIYVADGGGTLGSGRVQIFDLNGNQLSQFNTPEMPAVGDLFFIAVDNNENILLSEASGSKVKKYDKNGNNIPIADLSANDPDGIAFDNAGNIHVVTFFDYKITKYDPVGGSPQVLVTQGNFIVPLAIDNSGNIYTATFASTSTLYKYSSTGGSPLLTVNNIGNRPINIALDSSGNIYAASFASGKVTKIPASGGTPITLTLPGLTQPWGIAIDNNNNLYVTDQFDDKVKVYNSNGTFLREFGGTGTGPGQFTDISSIAIK